jgi:hypothetical protein
MSVPTAVVSVIRRQEGIALPACGDGSSQFIVRNTRASLDSKMEAPKIRGAFGAHGSEGPGPSPITRSPRGAEAPGASPAFRVPRTRLSAPDRTARSLRERQAAHRDSRQDHGLEKPISDPAVGCPGSRARCRPARHPEGTPPGRASCRDVARETIPRPQRPPSPERRSASAPAAATSGRDKGR